MSKVLSKFRSRLAFTLVELLVVIGIIAILVALLLPTLARARQQAMVVVCGSNMRQTLTAIQMYNNQYKSGLQNYHPNCTFWGKGWDPNKAGTHWLAGNITGPGGFTHHDSEARSIASFWRGYLIEAGFVGKYNAATSTVTNADIAGCVADTSLIDLPVGSYVFCLQGAQGNHIELDIYSAAYRKSPPYVWFGPGCHDYYEVAFWRGSIYIGAGPYANTFERTSYKKRGPLLTCPNIAMLPPPQDSIYHPTHRPNWTWPRAVATLNQTAYSGPYAQNVGFSDGSVVYFESKRPGPYNPMR